MKLCVGVVEAHGMDTVGIYRIPGNTAAVNALKENLNLGLENVGISSCLQMSFQCFLIETSF